MPFIDLIALSSESVCVCAYAQPGAGGGKNGEFPATRNFSKLFRCSYQEKKVFVVILLNQRK